MQSFGDKNTYQKKKGAATKTKRVKSGCEDNSNACATGEDFTAPQQTDDGTSLIRVEDTRDDRELNVCDVSLHSKAPDGASDDLTGNVII